MAEELIFSCECGFGTSVWDEGNPYSGHIPLPGETRKTPKHYVYHPHSDAEFAIGNDRPHICLSCCHHFNVDSVKPRTKCAKCKSEDIVDICELGGRISPSAKSIHCVWIMMDLFPRKNKWKHTNQEPTPHPQGHLARRTPTTPHPCQLRTTNNSISTPHRKWTAEHRTLPSGQGHGVTNTPSWHPCLYRHGEHWVTRRMSTGRQSILSLQRLYRRRIQSYTVLGEPLSNLLQNLAQAT